MNGSKDMDMDNEIAYERMSLADARAWAKQAAEGEYLVEYEDTGMTDVQDPGSRCGFDDAELYQIDRDLRARAASNSLPTTAGSRRGAEMDRNYMIEIKHGPSRAIYDVVSRARALELLRARPCRISARARGVRYYSRPGLTVRIVVKGVR